MHVFGNATKLDGLARYGIIGKNLFCCLSSISINEEKLAWLKPKLIPYQNSTTRECCVCLLDTQMITGNMMSSGDQIYYMAEQVVLPAGRSGCNTRWTVFRYILTKMMITTTGPTKTTIPVHLLFPLMNWTFILMTTTVTMILVRDLLDVPSQTQSDCVQKIWIYNSI